MRTTISRLGALSCNIWMETDLVLSWGVYRKRFRCLWLGSTLKVVLILTFARELFGLFLLLR